MASDKGTMASDKGTKDQGHGQEENLWSSSVLVFIPQVHAGCLSPACWAHSGLASFLFLPWFPVSSQIPEQDPASLIAHWITGISKGPFAIVLAALKHMEVILPSWDAQRSLSQPSSPALTHLAACGPLTSQISHGGYTGLPTLDPQPSLEFLFFSHLETEQVDEKARSWKTFLGLGFQTLFFEFL